MADDHAVSVVLPTYGRPAYFEDAVKSVVTQTYPAVELVVVDDCSPEPVAPLLDGIDTDGVDVTLVRHEENRGAAAARNTGIDAVRGRYVAFIDDDDVWLETKLERQLAAMNSSGPNVGAVYTGQRYVDDGRTTNVRTPTTSGDVTEAMLRGASLNPFSCMLVEKSVVDTAGGVDVRFPSWQDREWYFRLSLHTEFAAVPEPLVVRRMGHEQISGDYETKRDVSYPLLLNKHLDLAREYGCEGAFRATLLRSLAGTALDSGRYRDAVRHALAAVRHRPTYGLAWMTMAAAVGGPVTHDLAKRVNRSVR
ncbi:glycosyltransferase family 2 protein [Halorubrum sp. 48-1-W]|uniref:glycosyltransferase family 2 protein n=1 Tax=Halorubrum sp. 48-1-W TaxID=2249761 RepID=UPI000DCDD21A|nr:glycosyltransferase family A protein [Halorubrum sp. 48-1-W]RAW45634.1 glycosyltransferase family 2 protein [Halorubrum sp. 48-1-W]